MITAALLWLIERVVPFESVIASFHGANLLLLGLSYLTVPLFVYVDANRTRVLTHLQGMTHSVGDLCRISYASSFYSLVLPAPAVGALVRWHRLSRRDDKPAQAFAVVVFGRALSSLITVFVGIACWAAEPVARAHVGWGVVLIVVALGLSFVLWLSSLSAGFRLLGYRRLTATLLLLLLNDLIALGSCYLLALAIDVPLSLAVVGWTRAYVLLLTILPVSVIGFGIREAGLIAMLALYQLDAASVVAYSTLVGGRGILAAALGGCIELGALLRRDRAEVLRVRDDRSVG